MIEPVNLLESVPPKVSSPFWELSEVVGSNETATRLVGMRPWLNALSVTAKCYMSSEYRALRKNNLPVGIVWLVAGLRVPSVKSTGPILCDCKLSLQKVETYSAYPKIPSTPEKPEDLEATPTPWFGMTNEPIVTVSVYSVPENEPEPYVTDYDMVVLVTQAESFAASSAVHTTLLLDLTLVEVVLYAVPAPTQVLELPVSTIKSSDHSMKCQLQAGLGLEYRAHSSLQGCLRQPVNNCISPSGNQQ